MKPRFKELVLSNKCNALMLPKVAKCVDLCKWRKMMQNPKECCKMIRNAAKILQKWFKKPQISRELQNIILELCKCRKILQNAAIDCMKLGNDVKHCRVLQNPAESFKIFKMLSHDNKTDLTHLCIILMKEATWRFKMVQNDSQCYKILMYTKMPRK